MNPEIRKPTEKERNIASSWPIWEKGVSEFPWVYDEKETCLLIEGQVTVIGEGGKEYKFQKGDLVIFSKGLKCRWKITKPVKKYYKFG
jgi:uncharacterized protein